VAAEVHEAAALVVAALARQGGQVALADIADIQSEMKLLLSVPPLTGRLFLAVLISLALSRTRMPHPFDFAQGRLLRGFRKGGNADCVQRRVLIPQNRSGR
jgi:hypothetical protein